MVFVLSIFFIDIHITTGLTVRRHQSKQKCFFYRTLRLDEVDRTNIGKSKKQKIKNLRNVCNRLLDFCDRQDADDVFYEQVKENFVQVPLNYLALSRYLFGIAIDMKKCRWTIMTEILTLK